MSGRVATIELFSALHRTCWAVLLDAKIVRLSGQFEEGHKVVLLNPFFFLAKKIAGDFIGQIS